jgi:hypothetical protein
MAEREFAEALAGDPDRVDREGCFAGRLKARLSSQGRREIANHLAGIQRVFAQELRRKHPPQARLKTCTLTAVYLYSPRDAED